MDDKKLLSGMRSAFIAEHLKDVPQAYQNLLSDNFTTWDQEAKAINERARTDAVRLLAAHAPSSTRSDQPLDFTKMTGDQLIGVGIQPVPGSENEERLLSAAEAKRLVVDLTKSGDQLLSEGLIPTRTA